MTRKFKRGDWLPQDSTRNGFSYRLHSLHSDHAATVIAAFAARTIPSTGTADAGQAGDIDVQLSICTASPVHVPNRGQIRRRFRVPDIPPHVAEHVDHDCHSVHSASRTRGKDEFINLEMICKVLVD